MNYSKYKAAFIPFENGVGNSLRIFTVGWVSLILLVWVLSSFGSTNLFPTPKQVGEGFVHLWNEGLVVHIVASLGLCLKSILIATVISLILVYASPITAIAPLSIILSRFRFLPYSGLTFYFSIMIHNARATQTWLLVFFMTTFFVTSISAMVKDIPLEEFDHAKADRCSKFEILWEVIVKGRADYVIEVLRQNLAIVWMMIVGVESILVASGGIGVLIKNSEKFMNYGRIVALQIIILAIGSGLDTGLRALRRRLFSYSKF